MNQTFQDGGQDAVLVFKESITQLFSRRLHTTTFSLKGNQCTGLSLTMKITQQCNMPWFASLYHNIHINMTLADEVQMVYEDVMATEQRFINLAIADTDLQKNCSLELNINPLTIRPTYSPAYWKGKVCHIESTVLKCPLINQSRTFFVVYGSFMKSWSDVKTICNILGASMPYVISRRDSIFLRKLLLRSSKIYSLKTSPPHCRHFDPICGIFIGLDNTKVSTFL